MLVKKKVAEVTFTPRGLGWDFKSENDGLRRQKLLSKKTVTLNDIITHDLYHIFCTEGHRAAGAHR